MRISKVTRLKLFSTAENSTLFHKYCTSVTKSSKAFFAAAINTTNEANKAGGMHH